MIIKLLNTNDEYIRINTSYIATYQATDAGSLIKLKGGEKVFTHLSPDDVDVLIDPSPSVNKSSPSMWSSYRRCV